MNSYKLSVQCLIKKTIIINNNNIIISILMLIGHYCLLHDAAQNAVMPEYVIRPSVCPSV